MSDRYSPYYDYDEQKTTMSIDDEGSWVHSYGWKEYSK